MAATLSYTVSLRGFKFPSGYTIRDIQEELKLAQRPVLFEYADGTVERGFRLKASGSNGIRGKSLNGKKTDDFYIVVNAWI